MATLYWDDSPLIADVEATTRKNIGQGLKLVLRSAKANCPVGTEEREVAKRGANAGKPWTARIPGTLKKSGRTRMSKDRKKLSGQVIFGGRSSSKLTAYYALIVDLRQPFLRPALESNFDAVMAGMQDTLK